MEVLEAVAEMTAEKTAEEKMRDEIDRLGDMVTTARMLAGQIANPECVRVGYSSRFTSMADEIFADGCRLKLTDLMSDIRDLAADIEAGL